MTQGRRCKDLFAQHGHGDWMGLVGPLSILRTGRVCDSRWMLLSQDTYIYINVPSLAHFGSGFGTICTLLIPRWINHASLCYCVSSCPLHTFVTA
jgi:hypothetical protein